MLVLHRDAQRWEDRMFREFPEFLRPGDCLVLNDSRVFPSRLYGRRAGVRALPVGKKNPARAEHLTGHGGSVPGAAACGGSEALAGAGASGTQDAHWRAGPLRRGPRSRDHGARRVTASARCASTAKATCAKTSSASVTFRCRPTYGGPTTRPTASATRPCSPRTPGRWPRRPPDCTSRRRCWRSSRAAGAEVAYVTLHVGLGTFQPIRTERWRQHPIHSESSTSSPKRTRGGCARRERRVAVGTTSVRTIESAARGGRNCRRLPGDTELYIYPGFEFRATDAMLTNFHLPRSSLLVLVSAFAGREFVLDAYRHAVEAGYRFYSYGDCMLTAMSYRMARHRRPARSGTRPAGRALSPAPAAH